MTGSQLDVNLDILNYCSIVAGSIVGFFVNFLSSSSSYENLLKTLLLFKFSVTYSSKLLLPWSVSHQTGCCPGRCPYQTDRIINQREPHIKKFSVAYCSKLSNNEKNTYRRCSSCCFLFLCTVNTGPKFICAFQAHGYYYV